MTTLDLFNTVEKGRDERTRWKENLLIWFRCKILTKNDVEQTAEKARERKMQKIVEIPELELRFVCF